MTASACRAAVVGHPVAHSLSPVLHAAAYHQLGVARDYTRLDLPEQQWPAFWQDARLDPQWSGFSVTMPHKPHAAASASELTPRAQALGVANTLVARGAGRWLADNTDVTGIMAALTVAGEIPAAPRCAVLGGGGTAAAAVAALHALNAEQIDVFVRTPSRAQELGSLALRIGATVSVRPWEEAADHLETCHAVVSTLPPRGADSLATEWVADSPRVSGVLLDVAYDPWPSVMSSAWTRAGGSVAPGIDMLIYQAVDQVRWFINGSVDQPLENEAAVVSAMCRAVNRPERQIPLRVREALNVL